MLLSLFSKIQNFCCPRKKRNQKVVPSSSLPWLWIGAVYDDGTVKDYTEKVNEVITNDMYVSPRVLNFIISDNTPVSWTYLDTKTLESKEFPSSGLVIDGN